MELMSHRNPGTIPNMDPKMAFHIKVYASSDILNQSWISDLTHMVNAIFPISDKCHRGESVCTELPGQIRVGV
jgi:hypothetical protein